MKPACLIALFAAACSAQAGDPAPAPSYASQVDVASPDYAAMLRQPAPTPRGGTERERTAAMPAGGKQIGDLWIARLQALDAVDGYGLAGKEPDGPVEMIDTRLTESDFNALVARNGWVVPAHITWSFRPELAVPAVSEAARPAIRIWPASTRRTGLQNQALLTGRLVLRDGCFFVDNGDGKERLAWFLAETGLDVDADGTLILRERIAGQMVARVGEQVVWAGPNGVPPESELDELRAACGPGEVAEVGNPEAAERFYVQYPHVRPPPAG